MVEELLQLVTGLAVTALVFAAGAWSYPIGRATVWRVGWATMAVVLVMGAPAVVRAWRSGRGAA